MRDTDNEESPFGTKGALLYAASEYSRSLSQYINMVLRKHIKEIDKSATNK